MKQKNNKTLTIILEIVKLISATLLGYLGGDGTISALMSAL